MLLERLVEQIRVNKNVIDGDDPRKITQRPAVIDILVSLTSAAEFRENGT